MKKELKIENRIESLKRLKEKEDNCDGFSCRKCFFGGEKHQCVITEPYRMEQKRLNEKTGLKIGSMYKNIKWAYAELFYNDIIVKKNLDF